MANISLERKIIDYPARYPITYTSSRLHNIRVRNAEVVTDRGVVTFTHSPFGGWYAFRRDNRADTVSATNILTCNGDDHGPLLDLGLGRVDRNDGKGRTKCVGYWRFTTETAALCWAADVVLGLADPFVEPANLTA